MTKLAIKGLKIVAALCFVAAYAAVIFLLTSGCVDLIMTKVVGFPG